MRMEFYLLAIVAAAAVASACMPRRPPNKSAPKQVDDVDVARTAAAVAAAAKTAAAFKHLTEHFKYRVDENRRLIAKAMNEAGGQLYMTNFKRGLLEDCIRRAEFSLHEQDSARFFSQPITSGMEMNYLKAVEGIDRLESSWILSQQKVQALVQEINDHVFNLQTLAEELNTWKLDELQPVQEEASRLYKEIVAEAETIFKASGKLHAEACADPVGVGIEHTSPQVIKFREGRGAARSKIRTDLAAARETQTRA